MRGLISLCCLAACASPSRTYIPLQPNPNERYGSSGGNGGGGEGPQSQPYAALDPIVSPQRGGTELLFTFETRDQDGVALIEHTLFVGGEAASDPVKLGGDAASATVSLPASSAPAAYVRLIVTDSRGNQTIVDSNDFAIDAIAPPTPSVTWLSATPGNDPTVSYRVDNCAAGSVVTWSAGASVPANATWVDCAQAGSIPLALDGDYTLVVFAKDELGNVSLASDPFAFTLDRTAPLVAIVSPQDGALLRTATQVAITYAAADAHLSLQAAHFFDSTDAGASYHDLGTSSSTVFDWTTPAAGTTTGRLRLVVTDAAGNAATDEIAVSLDATPPVLVAFSADAIATYEPPPVLSDPVTALDVTAQDDIGGIVAYCVKHTQGPTLPISPPPNDACWIPVANTLALAVDDYLYRYGAFREVPYRVLVWAKDAAGRISVNAGMLGVDRVNLVYDPGVPPLLTNVYAMNSETPSWPLQPSDTVAPSGTTLYIKWNASFPNNAPASSGAIDITLGNGAVIATGITNTAGCNLSGGPAFTGCYVWSGVGAPSGFYDIRVTARDRKEIATTRNVVPPINATNGTSGVEFYAGNSDPGIGGNALSTYFNTLSARQQGCAVGSLAVSSRGVVYFLDPTSGLFWVNPATGNSELLLKRNPLQPSTGDGGNVRNATTQAPSRIDLDHQDRVYVNEGNRLRRIEVDAAGFPTTIHTLIGGGAINLLNGTSIDATLVQWRCRGCPILPLQSGDIYTFQDTTDTGATFRILRYHDATGFVDAIRPTGTGWLADAAPATNTPIDDCHMDPVGGEVDLTTDTLKSALIRVGGYGITGTCDPQHSYGWAQVDGAGQTLPLINPATGYFNATTSCQVFTGLDGFLYWLNPNTAGVIGSQNNRLYRREADGSWTQVLGDGTWDSTNCADGATALGCRLNVPAYFVSKPATPGQPGDVFWSAEGVVRTLDRNNNVITLMGQPTYFGDSPYLGAQTPSLSARFGNIAHWAPWIDLGGVLRLVLVDFGTGYIREAEQGGVVRTLAGNGKYAWTGSAGPSIAVGNPILLSANTTIAVDDRPARGDVYFDYDSSKTGLLHLDRPADQSTAQWTRVVGCTAVTGCTRYDGADGLSGSLISYTKAIDADHYDVTYMLPLVGFHNGKLMQSASRWYWHQDAPGAGFTADYLDSMFEEYDTDDAFRQSRFAGVAGPAPTGLTGPTGTSGVYGITGSPAYTQEPFAFPNYRLRSQAPTGMYLNNWLYGHPDSVFDAAGGRWLHSRRSPVHNPSIAALPVIDGFISTWAFPPRNYSAFTIRRDLSNNEYIYYCKANLNEASNPQPDDNRIYVARVDGSSELMLPWSIPGMHCRGARFYWDLRDGANPKLVFVYERDGLYGVAAYRNPPFPP